MNVLSMLAAGPEGHLLYALPGLGVLLVTYGLYQLTRDLGQANQQKVIDRLKQRSGGADRTAKKSKDSLIRKQLQDNKPSVVEGFVANLSVVPKLQRVLDQANVAMSAPKLLVNLAAAALVAGVGVAAAGYSPLIGLALAGAIFALPLLSLSLRRKKRLSRLVNQLPDVFELLSQALRAGHSLASGIQLVSQQLPAPASEEFGRVWHEQNLGIKIEDALRNMGDRLDQLDLRFFVTAVLIQRQTGGDLAEVLDKIGSVIRERIKLFGTVKALTAEGRLSGYVLVALPPVIFAGMMVVNRDHALMLIQDTQGRMALIIAAVMQALGFAMIKKITNIRV